MFVNCEECGWVLLNLCGEKCIYFSIVGKFFECVFGVLVSIVVDLLKEFYKGENLNVLFLKVKIKW